MIDAQAAHITRLNKENIELRAEVDRYRTAHDYYMLIQNFVRDDTFLNEMWVDFMNMIQLRTSKEVEGLTKPESEIKYV